MPQRSAPTASFTTTGSSPSASRLAELTAEELEVLRPVGARKAERRCVEIGAADARRGERVGARACDFDQRELGRVGVVDVGLAAVPATEHGSLVVGDERDGLRVPAVDSEQ